MPLKALVFQRESHVAPGVLSLSVAARLTEPLDYLQDRGELVYATLPEHDPVAEQGLKWADVILFSKHNSHKAVHLAQHARERGVRIVYDVDDRLLEFPKYSGAVVREDMRQATLELLRLSDAVTVANERLLCEIHAYCEFPMLVPNGIYVEKYRRGVFSEPKDEAWPYRIVFTNADFLKIEKSKDALLRVLQDFFLRHPDYLLDFYGDPFPEMYSLPFLHFTSRMPYQDYMRALVAGGYQFAITPLGGVEDEEYLVFNSCKNPFKYLNYGAASVPGVYSRSPIYEQCVRHGETGLLVENCDAAWREALERIAGDPTLRAHIRAAAYDDVCRRYHISDSAKLLFQAMCGRI